MKNDPKLSNYMAKQQLKDKRSARAKKDNKLFLTVAAASLAVAFAGQLAYFSFGPGASSETASTSESETPDQSVNEELVPDPALSEDRIWSGSMLLSDSPIEFELDGTVAPQAVANFVSLTQSGFFENVSCHRLVTEGIFVLQCGDPDGNGSGGPGYSWGPIENAPEGDLYEEGVIAMARVGGDDYSMGSQFFIVYEDSQIPSDMVGGYTVFGKVTSGLDVVKAIAQKGTDSGATDGSPIEPVTMTSISVE